MRIADTMKFEQVRSNISKNRSEMSELQNQAATQKRVTKPSDDPVAASRVLATRVDLSGQKQFGKNLSYAKSFMEVTDQSLSELSDNLIRVKELILSQVNDASASPESRRVVAAELRQVYEQIVSIGNRKMGDRFIFGGYKTTAPPFDWDGHYSGDSGEMMIHTDKGAFMAINLPGSKVFMGQGLSGDGIAHSTSRQAVTIEEFLAKRSESNQVIEPGANPTTATNPKEVGPTGPSSSEPSAQLRGPASMGATGAGLPSSSSSPTSGELSSNVQDIDENAAVVGAGSEAVIAAPAEGGVNLFQTLKRLETALIANDKHTVQDGLEVMDKALSQVVMARAQVGSRSMALDNIVQTLDKAKVDSQILISQMEDADIFKTISDLTKNESTLQATLQTSGRLVQPSLLDFLR